MDRTDTTRERWELLEELNALLDKPMIALSVLWLGLMIVELTAGLSRWLEILSYAVWALFGLHFVLGIAIAPSKAGYLRANWLTAVALVLPAFRLLRAFRALRLLRAARAVRSLSLLRVITSLNRGMRAVNRALGSRGAGYVAALTAVMTFAGAAGMARFESPAALREAGYPELAGAGQGLRDYGEALWWTATIMTTMGSEYWPKTVEGRILGWLLALYAFAVFGYTTAAIASFFVVRDAASRGTTTGSEPTVQTGALLAEVAALRAQLSAVAEQVGARSPLDDPRGG